jgi:hypothetical protein
MNEDFVSFSLAKKLKEKGFRWDCFAYYMPHSDELIYNVKPYKGVTLYSFNSLRKELISSDFIDAPTISQVLKWLRDAKKIYLELVIAADAEYMCDIYKIDARTKCLGSTEYYKTYEAAALVGTEYVINNLI